MKRHEWGPNFNFRWILRELSLLYLSQYRYKPGCVSCTPFGAICRLSHSWKSSHPFSRSPPNTQIYSLMAWDVLSVEEAVSLQQREKTMRIQKKRLFICRHTMPLAGMDTGTSMMKNNCKHYNRWKLVICTMDSKKKSKTFIDASPIWKVNMCMCHLFSHRLHCHNLTWILAYCFLCARCILFYL